MPYAILTKDSVIDYVLKTPKLRDFFVASDKTSLQVKELSEGNLNIVFVISQVKQPEVNLILKQAVPYLRCAGKDHPLKKERMLFEISALQKFSVIVPKHIPKIYHEDKEMCLVAMEYLGQHEVLRAGMINATYYPNFSDHISTFLAETLFRNSKLHLTAYEFTQLIKEFNVNELRTLTDQYIFTYPFHYHKTNKIHPSLENDVVKLWTNPEFKTNRLRLKNLFLTQHETLLHGDLHSGSVMLNEEETYVIDPEFAFVGPFGFDLGLLLAHLMMSWMSHFERSQDERYQHWILKTIKECVDQFQLKFVKLWNAKCFMQDAQAYQQKFMLGMLQDAIGFAGIEIIRRQIGLAGVNDIRGLAEDKSAKVAKMALNVGMKLVIEHQRLQKVEDMILVMLAVAEQFYPTKKKDYAPLLHTLGMSSMAIAGLWGIYSKFAKTKRVENIAIMNSKDNNKTQHEKPRSKL